MATPTAQIAGTPAPPSAPTGPPPQAVINGVPVTNPAPVDERRF